MMLRGYARATRIHRRVPYRATAAYFRNRLAAEHCRVNVIGIGRRLIQPVEVITVTIINGAILTGGVGIPIGVRPAICAILKAFGEMENHYQMTTDLLEQWSIRAATRTSKSEIAQIAGLTPVSQFPCCKAAITLYQGS